MLKNVTSLKKLIYFDHNSTTITHPEVVEFIAQISHYPMNASAPHSFGRVAFELLEEARNKILAMLGLNQDFFDIIFTSSGTEANNLIIKNFMQGAILLSSIEHPSIANFQEQSDNIYIINTDQNGYITPENLEQRLSDLKDTKHNLKLFSFIYGHNETGVVQKYFKDLIKIARKYNFLLHSDMSQCPGKIMLQDLEMLDFITLSSHKIGGPMGVGALIKNKKHLLHPMIIGGGQENNMRAGTENILAISGFGEIAQIISRDYSIFIEKLAYLRNFLEYQLLSKLNFLKIIHKDSIRLANTSFIVNPYKTADRQIIEMDLEQIAISSGSSCQAKKKQISNIFKNIGYNQELANHCIRVSFGLSNNIKEIENFLDKYIAKNISYIS